MGRGGWELVNAALLFISGFELPYLMGTCEDCESMFGFSFVYVLFEDDTDIQNGPDLYVWVLPAEDYDGGDPVEYLDLGKLKGNVGGQNYELPDNFDPDVHQTVLIWCLRFGVPFAAVPLG